MLFRLVAADLRTVLKKNIVTFIAVAAVTVANLVYAYGLSSVYGVRTDTLGFADNLALVFAGSAPFEPRPGLMFVPPLGWLFVILLILYTTLDYPTESLHGFGLQALVRCRSRTLWWVSRFILVAAVTAFSLLVVVCSVVIWSLMVSASFSAVIHGESLQLALAIDRDFAFGRLDQSADRSHKHGLTRTVYPLKPNHGPRVNLDGHVALRLRRQ